MLVRVPLDGLPDPGRTFPNHCLSNQWKKIKKAGEVDIPDGMVIYSFRHFFARTASPTASRSPTSPNGWDTEAWTSPSKSSEANHAVAAAQLPADPDGAHM
ncbi:MULTISPECIES: hypothetical protein [Streptomyces]|uniref:Uncharacterized protein n=1 Tax=Streptomyces ehimensis TaxID=68195 RepID=A0ABV9BW29_9ACTN